MNRFFDTIQQAAVQCRRRMKRMIPSGFYFGRHLRHVPPGAVVFFPVQPGRLNCGLSGLIGIKARGDAAPGQMAPEQLSAIISGIEAHGLDTCLKAGWPLEERYLNGQKTVTDLLEMVRAFKRGPTFFQIFSQPEIRGELSNQAQRLADIVARQERQLTDTLGTLDVGTAPLVTRRIEDLKDALWCLTAETLDNVPRIGALAGDGAADGLTAATVHVLQEVNTVLNSIDRLEVRGRDSAGISILLTLEATGYERFRNDLAGIDGGGLLTEFTAREEIAHLLNGRIDTHTHRSREGRELTGICLTYKVAAEIGSLGDNIRFLRDEIGRDRIFRLLAASDYLNVSVFSHTRWASVGAICEANCHPVDNRAEGATPVGILHACLNGDIDNYLALSRSLAEGGVRIPDEITTDTKIIPLQIQKYVQAGHGIEEAFRLAVNDFDGSHAIAVQTDLAPDRLLLAQRGSGQAIFVGLAADHYMATSEVYGFVEETHRYLKLDGERVVEGKNGPTQGQIFILNQEKGGGLAGIEAMYYDGTPIELSEADIKTTELTARDIDRQGFPHYFLKEISEAPTSVEKTLHNRWKTADVKGRPLHRVTLDETMVPASIRDALTGREGTTPIQRIFFMGQGTAGVAAMACADILNYYLNDPVLPISALKASELSGFRIGGGDAGPRSMANTLVIAISQSGTTTDTNRTVDMVRARGAHAIGIVNRRDSDLTFKVNGVIYTSSGRDIEMSVASTKAFYSQIVAGALLGLFIAELKGRRTPEFISDEINRLLELPGHMRKILADTKAIETSARRLAQTKLYWAAVGSGPNKASADEIRIKLSELCYKTISSDYVEDKKHIDLSSEPLILVCAAGTKSDVLGDIIKDTAIFKAHKATPLVIADEGEDRFDPYADAVFHVPPVAQHLAPVLNTLVGHVWGYYAALSIHEGSRFLYGYRQEFQRVVDQHVADGLDVFEVILEKSFREMVGRFYNEVRIRRREMEAPIPIALASDIILLLKYLSGRLPAADFELDFGVKGTARKMLEVFFEYMGRSINAMARPVDAIKHQAKTVTVGTSRITEKVEGILFDALADYGIGLAQLINNNIIVLKNLQGIVSAINGAILYRIGGLDFLGEPTEASTIEVIEKRGVLAPIPSRVETDKRLKGTKRIIVRQGNVYIGKGRKDDRSIIIIPVISSSPDTPHLIEFLLLLNIAFKETVPLPAKVKALGGKHEHIKNIVQENSILWDDQYLDLVEMGELFGRSAEKIGEYIVKRLSPPAA